MRARVISAVLGASFFAAGPAWADEYYVATTGDDSNPGTEAQPFKTVGRGQQAASAGDTVWVRGGTWTFTSGTVGVAFSKAGQANNLINYYAYPGETPVFDLGGISNPSGRVTGFDVHTNYIHIRGMEIKGVPQYMNGQDSWGLRIQGSNNIIEMMNVHDNEAPGVFITSGSGNLILNCDSHHNYDVLESGGSGDGFGCHSSGGSNVIRGCRAWSNSDDGYDFINASGDCTVENSWSWRNGYIPDTMTTAGNGAGFKSGGYGTDTSNFPATPAHHNVRQCLAFRNRSQGFYANHHPGPIDFLNNTAVNNNANFDMLADVGMSSHTLRNNLAFGSGGTISRLTGGTDSSNSWNLGVTVASDDFVNEMESEAEAPRQADGSLPNIGFMHLADGSDLIDKGTDVGLPFAGSAPDLGCFEVGLDETSGTGGMGGAMNGGGGTDGSGGSDAMGGAGGMGGNAMGGDTMGGSAMGGSAGADMGAGGSAVAAGGASGAGMAGAAAGGSSGMGAVNGGAGAGVGGAVAMGAGTGGTVGGAAAGGPASAASAGTTPTSGATSMSGATAAGGSSGLVPGTRSDQGQDAGCACRLSPRSGGRGSALLSALALIVAFRRRRRATASGSRA